MIQHVQKKYACGRRLLNQFRVSAVSIINVTQALVLEKLVMSQVEYVLGVLHGLQEGGEYLHNCSSEKIRVAFWHPIKSVEPCSL